VIRYIEVAKLNPEEHFLLRQKLLNVDEIFPTAKHDWEFASRASTQTKKEKLRGILLEVLAQNSLIDRLTDWAKNVVFWF
jgi:hypothetical protein